jgi:hypothetical protein
MLQESSLARLSFLFIACAIASAVHAGSTTAPENIYAQKLVDETIAAYPDLLVVALHVTPPKSSNNVIIASNIGLIGKRADAEDLKVINTGETLTKINKLGNRTEVEQPLHDASQRRIGSIAMVFPYKAGDDESQFVLRAARIRDELERKIPDAASLMKSNARGP